MNRNIKLYFLGLLGFEKVFKGSDQRENRRVWSNINTRYLVWGVVLGVLFTFYYGANML